MLDPPRAPKFVAWRNLESHWTGNVMLFADTAADADRLKAELNSAATRQYVPYILGGISLVVLLALVVSTVPHAKPISYRPRHGHACATSNRRRKSSRQWFANRCDSPNRTCGYC